MNHTYQIKYDLKKDIWNWYDALNNSFMGYNWIDNIDRQDDKKIALKISGLKKSSVNIILKPYLEHQIQNPNSRLNRYLKIINLDFSQKYTDACLILEHLTQYPLMSNQFTFYVTTFPRSPYFYDKCEIFMYNSTAGFWSMPIDGFLHEGLHFQFTYYWRKNKNSPVSKLNPDKFEYLKEALTVVLDKNLKPILTIPDTGYPHQQEFRRLLSKHWIKHHHFGNLIEYGLSILDSFI